MCYSLIWVCVIVFILFQPQVQEVYIMRILFTSGVLLSLLPVAIALAQIDPDPDGLGIYFDEAATQVVTTAGAMEELEAYLIATNCSQTGGIVMWEAYVTVSGPGVVDGTPTVGVNTYTNMPGSTNHNFIVLIDLDNPLPIQDVLILANLFIGVYSADDSVELYLSGAPQTEYPYYSTEFWYGPYHNFYPSSGSLYMPVAVINGEAPISNKNSTWGGIKTLYQ